MKSKYPLKKGQIEEGVFEDHLGTPTSNMSLIISDTQGNRTWTQVNKFAGPLLGQIDVAGINIFYEDYVTGPVVDFTLSPNKILGTKVYARVRGGLVGIIPAAWNFSGDVISVTDTDFNELTFTYVSDKDVRVENRIVPFVDTIAPSVPQNLVSSNITTTSFDVAWDASTDSLGGAVTYNVYNNDVLVGNVATNSTSITGVTEYSMNMITVTALDADSNESDPSTALSVRTLDVTAPSIPANLTTSNFTDTSFDLSWDVSTDNDATASYNVYKDTVLLQNVTTNTISVTGLTLGVDYSMTVSALDGTGNESAQSAALIVNTDITLPSTPTGLASTNVGETSFDLNWVASTDNLNVVSYNVYKDSVFLINVNTTTTTVSGLVGVTPYSMTVSALDGAGNESEQSAALIVTTTAEVVTAFTATYSIPTDGYAFTLPLSQGALTYGTGDYQNNFVVDWGDGSQTTVVNGVDFDTLRTHTYTTAGTYTQTIEGTCEYFSWNWENSASTMTSIDYWGSVGFKFLNFAGAGILASLPSGVPDFSALENIDGGGGVAFFEDCPNIITLPAGIFDNAPALRAVSGLFNSYSTISSFTGPLFPNSPLIENVDNLFSQSTFNIGTITPADLGTFPGVTTMQYTFGGPNHTAIPSGLMDIFPNLVTSTGVFWGCTGLTTIPSSLLVNTNITSIENMFQNCSGLTAIPADFFDGIPNVDNIYMLFRDAIGLTGLAPQIWLRNPAPTTRGFAFQNCTGLSNYADIPVGWK